VESADSVEAEAPGEGPDPRIGTVVAGSFRLLQRLGSGGMGDVYEAEQVRLGRRVAVKLLRRELVDRKETRLRFEREARLAASIASEHVVGILDCGELPDGTPFLVMDLVRGEDLRTRLSRLGRLPIDEAVALALDACLGLVAVHRAGILHRDLKPANLFVVPNEDGPPRCKILDFGVAKALSTSDVTRQGVMLGTLRYMAPEQIQSAAKPDARADLYSLGAILYECLAGRPPHDGETREELLAAIVHRTPEPVRELRPEISPALGELVMRCLAREPGERFPSADVLARELARSEREVRRADQTLADATLEHDRPRQRARGGIGYGIAGLAVGAALGFWGSDRVRSAAGSSPPSAVAPAPGHAASRTSGGHDGQSSSSGSPVAAPSVRVAPGSANAAPLVSVRAAALVPEPRPTVSRNRPPLEPQVRDRRPAASASASASLPRLEAELEVESPYTP
jgi:serine/threonine-protein kinase